MSESRVVLQVTLDSVEATLVVFNSWKSGMEKPGQVIQINVMSHV